MGDFGEHLEPPKRPEAEQWELEYEATLLVE